MERPATKVMDEKKSLQDVAKDFEVGFRLVRYEVTDIPYTNFLRC